MSLKLDLLKSKELYKDVLIRLVHGNELSLNYFELGNEKVNIPFHKHPVEHLVIVLKGQIEFIFKSHKTILIDKEILFIPAKISHTARVIRGPVKALEIYKISEDQYYK